MEYLVGIILALAVIILIGRLFGFEKDRSFYPTLLIVIALLYVLFSAIDGRPVVIIYECAIALAFIAAALLGYTKSILIVAFGIAGHGLFDFVHGFIIENRGVPIWWPGFCAAVDVLLGIYLGIRVYQKPSANVVSEN